MVNSGDFEAGFELLDTNIHIESQEEHRNRDKRYDLVKDQWILVRNKIDPLFKEYRKTSPLQYKASVK